MPSASLLKHISTGNVDKIERNAIHYRVRNFKFHSDIQSVSVVLYQRQKISFANMDMLTFPDPLGPYIRAKI